MSFSAGATLEPAIKQIGKGGKWMTKIAYSIAWVAVCVAFGVSSTSAASESEAHFPAPKFIPKFPLVDCSGPGSKGHKACKELAFEIRAVEIRTPSGEPACLAYLPYNRLTVHVGTSNGGADITWKLGTKLKAKDKGMTFTAPPGLQVSHIIYAQSTVTATIRGGVPQFALNREFGHLPAVYLEINNVDVECGGADPGIVVIAD